MNGRAQYLSGTSDNLTGPTLALPALGLVVAGGGLDRSIGLEGTTIAPTGGFCGKVGPKGATGAASRSEGTRVVAGDGKGELGDAGVNIPGLAGVTAG
jgi:hypothetical protein